MLIAIGIACMILPNIKCSIKVVIVHGTDILPKNLAIRFLVRSVLNRFDHVVAVSRFTALKIPHAARSKVSVINNGYNNRLFPSPEFPKRYHPGKLSLVTVGSVTERKGQLNVLNILPALREKFGKVEYHVIGLPVLENELLSKASQLGVIQEVIVHGVLQHYELLDMLNKSDIFMMLSENTSGNSVEGFGIAVLEANALGLPAVGSKGTGLEDSICDGYSGYLVNPHDPLNVCRAIENICERYDEFSQNAIHHAQKFTWDNIGRKYLDLLAVHDALS